MTVLRSWSCGDCGVRIRVDDRADGVEAERLMQLARDSHRPHCDVLRAAARAAAEDSP